MRFFQYIVKSYRSLAFYRNCPLSRTVNKIYVFISNFNKLMHVFAPDLYSLKRDGGTH